MPSAIIIEDEVLAAGRLRVLLEECNVVLLKTFHYAQPVLDQLSVHETDIVFADIGLPEITGLELVERIKRVVKRQPGVIFTTVYEEHVLRAFELAAMDYLLKPIRMTRPQVTLNRVSEKYKEKVNDFAHFKVFSRDRVVEIPWQQARYLMAEHETVYLIIDDGQNYELPKTLMYWGELLGEKVIRIHHNALVFRHTLDCLIRLGGEEDESNASWAARVLDIEKPLPVSRRQLAAARKVLRGVV